MLSVAVSWQVVSQQQTIDHVTPRSVIPGVAPQACDPPFLFIDSVLDYKLALEYDENESIFQIKDKEYIIQATRKIVTMVNSKIRPNWSPVVQMSE